MADEDSTRNNIILIALLIINMVAVSLFGLYLFRRHKEAEAVKEKQAVALAAKEGEKKDGPEGKPEAAAEDNPYTRKVVRFESLITNLAGENGRRIVRLSLEARCEGDNVLTELTSAKPKVRDIIIGEVGNFSAEDLSSIEGKEKFKSQLRNDINAVLTTGKITEVYITELQLN